MITIHNKNLAAIINGVEGGPWLRDMAAENHEGYVVIDVSSRMPVQDALAYWLEGRPVEDGKESNSTGIVVYGLGGIHRYYVRSTGEIVFSRGHSGKAGQAKAEAAGFRLG